MPTQGCTTVFGYLTSKRMEQAEQLLHSGKLTVAEVANLIGYTHQGDFAVAFNRKFGTTPGELFVREEKYLRLIKPKKSGD